MNKYYENNKDLHVTFVGFKQTYDSVIRKQLWVILRNSGIPDKLVKLIQMYNGQTYFKVRFLGELSKIFEFKTGQRHGDAMSPVLFNLARENVVGDIQDTKEI